MNDMILEHPAVAGAAASAAARKGADQPPVLVYEHVRKVYGDFVALNDVSLQVNKGEVMCLIGPSGSGKSTLLRCTNALEKLDGGRVLLDGVALPESESDVRRVRQRMGMVFQSFELFPHKSALDNVAMGPITVLGMSPEAARARAMALLEKVGL
ncbi:MAG: ATP-binding cassette domain-containing protein, partial [Alcaligenes sp.]